MSIRTRLTLWYIGLLGIILFGFGFLFYSILYNSLMAEVDRNVHERARQVISFIQAENDPLSLFISGVVRLPPIDVFSAPDIYVQILRLDGKVVSRSDNLGAQSLPVEKAMLESNARGEESFCLLKVGDTRLHLLSAPLTIGGEVVGVVQVGQSLHGVDATLRLVLYLLLGGTGTTLALAALVGVFLTRAALDPIARITQTARRISQAEDLSRRLEEPKVQDEIGQLAATFNEMLGRLESLFKAQQRLIADVSHELRTPLTTIRGNVDLLKRGAAEDPQARRETLEIIEGEVSRMSRLVADLLLLAQADAGLSLEKKPVELDTLLLEVYRQARLMADGVEVKLGHEDQAIVLGDADRLKQLLLNLVDNALKYTPPGGEVKLSLYHDQDWVQVSVSDTGIGIPKEDLPYIFERFYRANKARSRGGTGLGLSIAQWIAQAHGGYLTVESEVGVGSTFTLWLKAMKSKEN